MNNKIEFLGQLPFSRVQQILGESKLLILPSICYEGFPMVIREAFALGTAVAVSNLGSMASIVNDGENGVVFPPGNVDGLLKVVKGVWERQDKLADMGKAARVEFEHKYQAETNHQNLMEIYNFAIQSKKTKCGP